MMAVNMVSRRPSQSSSMKSVQLAREDIHKGHLILVNASNPVRHIDWEIEYLPDSLLQANTAEEQQISLEKTCITQLSALLEASEAKRDIAVVSGYRSREAQERIYASSLKENGAAFTASYVALPGASEHQTGLAVDVGLIKKEIDYIRPSFGDEGASLVFKELAPTFGFIQRYEASKEKITGIACEPWHYRYVGFPHSAIMRQENLCLEEYTDFIKQFTYNDTHLYMETRSFVVEICYVQAEKEMIHIPATRGARIQLSGNNQDGFVVTVLRRKRWR